jgi:hypothetical protein
MLAVDVNKIIREEAARSGISHSLLTKAFYLQFEMLSENMNTVDINDDDANGVYSLPHFGKFIPDNRVIRSVRGKRKRWLQRKAKKDNGRLDELCDSQTDNGEGSCSESCDMRQMC